MLILNTLSDSTLIDRLHQGAVGVLPTDTVYGLACRAADPEAVSRLYKLKTRENKPGTIVAANIDQIIELGVPARYVKAVQQFWPNPVSIIVPTDPSLKYLDQGKFSLPFRVPKPSEFTRLLEKTGPLLTSSANQPGEPPANNIDEAKKYFGEHVDFYVDGGDLSNQQASTIIRMVDDAIEVIREGAVKIDEETGRIL
jgi:tRNA threonylcarbamoyl adenosine modification protein (Sua5/YciO/YrdC/YwlC family)